MPTSRTLVVAVAGLVALTALTACDPLETLEERRLDFTDTEQAQITEIRLSPGDGDLTVRTGTASGVEIKRVVRYRGKENPNEETYRIEGTTLHLTPDCGPQCSVSYHVVAPKGVAVRGENGAGDVSLTDVAEVDLRVDAGDIRISGASGAVRAETGSGDITLSRISGPVTAHADAGNVEGRDLGDGKVQAETGSGDITLTLATVGSVKARTSSGSIELRVPAGSYRVRTSPNVPDSQIEVRDDPAATEVLDVQADSGDVTIRQI
jgi:hypothetical protein